VSVSNRRLTGTVLDGGTANLPAVLAELNHLNYQGYLMIDYLGENDPRLAVPYNLAYLKAQLDKTDAGHDAVHPDEA
jgi:hypothetical protein